MPHGQAVSICLPYALEFNNFAPEVIAEVKQVIREARLPREFGGDIQEMARLVMTDERHLANNPRDVALGDIIEIFRKMRQEI
jgi:alcohol dehydrogenase class IV